MFASCSWKGERPSFTPWRVFLLGSSSTSFINHEIFIGHSLVGFEFERVGRECFLIDKVIFDMDGKEKEILVENLPLLFTFKEKNGEWRDSRFSLENPPSLNGKSFFKNRAKIVFMVVSDKHVTSLKEAKNKIADEKVRNSFEIISKGDFLYFLNLIANSSSTNVIFISAQGEKEVWPITGEDKKRVDFLIQSFSLK